MSKPTILKNVLPFRDKTEQREKERKEKEQKEQKEQKERLTKSTFGIFHRVIKHWSNYFLSRLPTSDSHHLTIRNIYVLPSSTGWGFAIATIVGLIAAINYQINLAFFITFMLVSVALASLWIAYKNIYGLSLALQLIIPTFVGVKARVDLSITQPKAKWRLAMGLRLQNMPRAQSLFFEFEQGEKVSEQSLWVETPKRGLHVLPAIVLESFYPLGVFSLWTLWRPAGKVLVYPAPEASPPPLPSAWHQADDSSDSVPTPLTVGEFDGVRSYQRGDPMKTILWRKSANAVATGSGEWLRRESVLPFVEPLWLDFSQTGLVDQEAALSRLCAWVLLASREEKSFGLRLPNIEIAMGQGEQHRLQCLQALALF